MAASPDLPLDYEYIEPRTDQPDPAPCVFVLHGRGANEQDLLPVARHFPDPIGIVSLRAPDRLMGGYTWYELDLSAGDLHASQPDPSDFTRSLDLVKETVTQATSAFSLASDRVGLFGFSQGAIMSFALILDHPADFAWCAGLHGYLPDSHADKTPAGIDRIPLFIGAGSGDEIIPAERVESAAERFEALGCDVSFSIYETGHGIGRAELTDLVEWVTVRVTE